MGGEQKEKTCEFPKKHFGYELGLGLGSVRGVQRKGKDRKGRENKT